MYNHHTGDPVLTQVMKDSLDGLCSPQTFAKVTKSRRKKHALGVSIEETAIKLNDNCEWTSVCFESYKPQDIDQVLSVKTGQGLTVKEVLLGIEGVRLEAYPLFIMSCNT